MADTEKINKILNLAYFFLKFRYRTKQEMVSYLRKKSKKYNINEQLIEAVIKRLEEGSYINDQQFIKWYVEDRNIARKKSSYAIKGELMRLGISKTLMDEYFENNQMDEESLACQTLKSCYNRFFRLDKKIRFIKAVQFLQRKGYSYDLAKNAYNQVF